MNGYRGAWSIVSAEECSSHNCITMAKHGSAEFRSFRLGDRRCGLTRGRRVSGPGDHPDVSRRWLDGGRFPDASLPQVPTQVSRTARNKVRTFRLPIPASQLPLYRGVRTGDGSQTTP